MVTRRSVKPIKKTIVKRNIKVRKQKHKELMENKKALAFFLIGIIFLVESLTNLFVLFQINIPSLITLTTMYTIFQIIKLIAGIVCIIAGLKDI